MARLLDQREQARTQRDRARERLRNLVPGEGGDGNPRDPFSAMTEELAACDRDRHLAEHLLQSAIKDLEYSESHPITEKVPWPLPPQELRFRIGGSRSGSLFLDAGRHLVEDLARLIEKSGRAPADFETVLDFGCGCGRVLRQLPGLFPDAAIHGADVDAEAISWCRENLGFVSGFHPLPLHPPSELPSSHFDFLFSLSVFTHLPLEVERAWLAELRRVARPGALVILTFLSEEAIPGHFPPSCEPVERVDGFQYFVTTPTEGLPDYYHVSFHTEEAMRRLVGEQFEILGRFPEAITRTQDALLCRCPGS